jgi:hypothetical protein
VTGDHRLLIDLEVLRLALSTYLTRLHALWQDGGEAREIERLLVAAGSYGEPLARDRDTVRELLAGAAGSTGELARTSEALGLSQGEELLVAAVWWAERDPQFAAVLGVAHDDGSHRYATAALVRLLLAPFDIEVPPVLGSDALLVREGVLATVAAPFDEPLRLTGSARLVLDGTTPAAAFPELAVPARLHGLRDALTRHLESGAGGVVLLRGPEGVGRRALAAAAARDAGRVPIDGERSAAACPSSPRSASPPSAGRTPTRRSSPSAPRRSRRRGRTSSSCRHPTGSSGRWSGTRRSRTRGSTRRPRP